VSDDLEPQVPPAGEEIHMPGSSIQPFLLAISITVALIGVTISWVLTIIGGIVTIWIIVRWIADTRRDVAQLPVEHE